MINLAQKKLHPLNFRPALISVCGVLLLAACSKSPAPEVAGPSTKAKSGFIVLEDTSASAASGPPKSVFTTGKGARDPFFPQAALAETGADPNAPAQAPVDIPNLLQEGLQWVLEVGSQRMAVLNNVTLEPNKTAQVPITYNGKRQMLTVRCVSIQKNTVTLMIPGQSTPVTIRQLRKK